jgi:6-phosphogluconolactonase (cycloisomerase 2 family)
MRLFLPTLLLFVHLVVCVNLYVASYSNGTWAGNISTLSLDQNADSTYSLSLINSINTSTNAPSWLTLDKQSNILWLVDEAVNLTTNGTLVSYQTCYSGQLTELNRQTAALGGVYATFYDNGGALAIPHYTGSALQTYNVTSSGGIQLLQTFNFSSPNFTAGAVADRQAQPHPHEAILDPTQQFLFIPDLGADEVHIFLIQGNNELHQLPPLKTNPGYGPRHGAFSQDKIAGHWAFYLVGELSGNVTAYKSTYGLAGIGFEEIGSYKTLNDGQSLPFNTDGSSEVAPAEVAVTVRNIPTFW